MANVRSIHRPMGTPENRHHCHAQTVQQLLTAQGLVTLSEGDAAVGAKAAIAPPGSAPTPARS